MRTEALSGWNRFLMSIKMLLDKKVEKIFCPLLTRSVAKRLGRVQTGKRSMELEERTVEK